MAIRSDYVSLSNGRQVHYRRGGSGAPVLLLHPSPLSSAFLQPLLQYLEPNFDVIAMDTPGYGNSDPLDDDRDNLEPYVDVIGEFARALGLSRVTVYGNATGAQLAIESAKAHENIIGALVLDNAACFSEVEQQSILADYFPDLTPQADGEHLALAWKIASQMYRYFPWYDTSDEACFSENQPPVELVDATARAYLQAGTDYARAYRAAFANERSEQLAAVTQATKVMLWQDSMLLSYSRRLQESDLPPNIEFVEVHAGVEARYGAIRDALSGVQQ